jgi:hypothetical protein
MPQQNIADLPDGSDKRSIGRANEVAERVQREPRRFRELIECLGSDNPVLRMRAAEAAEKVSAKKPRLLDRYKPELLGLLAEAEQPPRVTSYSSERAELERFPW